MKPRRLRVPLEDAGFSGPPKRPVPPRVVLILLLSSVATVAVQGAVTRPFNPEQECCDHLFYRSMAFNYFSLTRPDLDRPPPGNRLWTLYDRSSPQYISWLDTRNGLRRQPPYAFRFVVPLLARGIASITNNINVAFYFISFASLAGAGVFLALSVYALSGSSVLGILAIVLFASSRWVATVNLYDYMLTDPIAFLLTAVAIYALIRRRRSLFFAACLLGVFSKETLVPMLVSYPLSEILVERRVRASSILSALGIGGLWFLFRQVLPIPVNEYSFINEFRPTLSQLKGFLFAVAGTFGVLAVASWRILAAPVLLALVPFALAQLAGGWFVENIERAVVQALPVLILALLAVWPPSLVARALVIAPAAAQFMYLGLHSGLGMPSQVVLPPMLFIALCLEMGLVIRMRSGYPSPETSSRGDGGC